MGLIVGIWQVNTEANTWLALTHAARINYLKDAVETFWASIDVSASGLTFPALFVAPEYLFVKGEIGPEGRHRFACHHLEEAEKETWRAELWALHKRRPKIALIPGTILWRKQCAKIDLVKRMRQHQARLPHLMAPSEVETQLLGIEARKEQGLDAKYLGVNESWIFLGMGAPVYKKVTDVSEAWDPENTLHIGGDDIVICKLNGKWLGIEICQDHTVAVLKHGRQGREVDIHVILSAHLDAPFLDGHRCGNQLIHACSVSKQSGVFAGGPRAVTQRVVTASRYDVVVSTLPD